MEHLKKVSLPDSHEISECWHPHYHKSPFLEKSAAVLLAWHNKQFYGSFSLTAERVKKVAPLCIFGGVSFSPYVLNEQAHGTYAVCRKCKWVMMCGYGDKTGLGPKKCEKCNARLTLNDYFQPIEPGSSTQEKDLIDPKKDPAVVVAELCANVPTKGIPLDSLSAITAILKKEGLLASRECTGDFVIRNNYVEGPDIRDLIFKRCNDWIYLDPSQNTVKISKRGITMLKARKLYPLKQARSRVLELLVLPHGKLQAMAWKALAEMTLGA